jgi:trehalose 6-phosphate synthase
MNPEVVIASNRGPAANSSNQIQGSGGLIQTLTAALKNRNALWVAAKQASGANNNFENFEVIFPEIDDSTYSNAYNNICNLTLWFIHHHMIDSGLNMIYDEEFYSSWKSYQDYNSAFAETIAQNAPKNATVILNDYHLCLVPHELNKRRQDLKIIHFSHTPFANPAIFSMLPETIAIDILNGISKSRFAGFHVAKWSKNFLDCAKLFGVTPQNIFSFPVGIDPENLKHLKDSDTFKEKIQEIKAMSNEKTLMLRVDRLEPAKNILRGIVAFDMLLERNPTLQKEIFHLVLVNPSRENLAIYKKYKTKVVELAKKIKQKWPESFDFKIQDDLETSAAAMAVADILVVNPVRDGLNLVAKEACYLNNNLILILSKEAGAYDQLKNAAFGINPFDIKELSYVMESAIFLDPEERKKRSTQLKHLACIPFAEQWLDHLLSL